jgi:hypothetical protein
LIITVLLTLLVLSTASDWTDFCISLAPYKAVSPEIFKYMLVYSTILTSAITALCSKTVRKAELLSDINYFDDDDKKQGVPGNLPQVLDEEKKKAGGRSSSAT